MPFLSPVVGRLGRVGYGFDGMVSGRQTCFELIPYRPLDATEPGRQGFHDLSGEMLWPWSLWALRAPTKTSAAARITMKTAASVTLVLALPPVTSAASLLLAIGYSWRSRCASECLSHRSFRWSLPGSWEFTLIIGKADEVFGRNTQCLGNSDQHNDGRSSPSFLHRRNRLWADSPTNQICQVRLGQAEFSPLYSNAFAYHVLPRPFTYAHSTPPCGCQPAYQARRPSARRTTRRERNMRAPGGCSSLNPPLRARSPRKHFLNISHGVANPSGWNGCRPDAGCG